jgi:hypothetical protein
MATSKPALPYDRKLVTKWKNIGAKVVKTRYASLRDVHGQPGVWEALAAAFDAGLFPPEAVWYLGDHVGDHIPPRASRDVLRALPASYTSPLGAWQIVATPLARLLREDPAALDDTETFNETQRRIVEVARAEAGLCPDGPPADTRAALAAEWTAGNATFPALSLDGAAVTRVKPLDPDAQRVQRETAQRVFGPALAADLADAHRARLAAHTAVAGQPNAHALYPSADALRIAAPALTPEEVAGFQATFAELSALSVRWSVDDLLRAAASVTARNRPDAHLITNSLAVLAVARDPSCAPRAEPWLNLDDLTNQASPSAGYVFATLREAPAAWRRRFAVDVVFGGEGGWWVFRGPLALALLVDVDPAAAEALAEKHRADLDFTRINGADPHALLARVDVAGPRTREMLLLPTFVGFARQGANPPPSLDALFAFNGTYRDSWIAGYLLAIPEDRAVAIVRRELAEGRAKHVRSALEATGGAALLAAAKSPP